MPTLIVAHLLAPDHQLAQEMASLALSPEGSPWKLEVTLFTCRQHINQRAFDQMMSDQRVAPFLVTLKVHPLAVLGPTTSRSATDGCVLRAMPTWESLRKLIGTRMKSGLSKDRVLTPQDMPQILYGPLPEISRKRLCLNRLELRHVAEA